MVRHKWIVGLAMIGSAGVAVAQGPGPREGNRDRLPPLLAALDRDHDGVLSPFEIRHASEALIHLDRNYDGRLTSEEFQGEHGRSHDGDGPKGPGMGHRPDGHHPEDRGPHFPDSPGMGPGGPGMGSPMGPPGMGPHRMGQGPHGMGQGPHGMGQGEHRMGPGDGRGEGPRYDGPRSDGGRGNGLRWGGPMGPGVRHPMGPPPHGRDGGRDHDSMRYDGPRRPPRLDWDEEHMRGEDDRNHGRPRMDGGPRGDTHRDQGPRDHVLRGDRPGPDGDRHGDVRGEHPEGSRARGDGRPQGPRTAHVEGLNPRGEGHEEMDHEEMDHEEMDHEEMDEVKDQEVMDRVGKGEGKGLAVKVDLGVMEMGHEEMDHAKIKHCR